MLTCGTLPYAPYTRLSSDISDVSVHAKFSNPRDSPNLYRLLRDQDRSAVESSDLSLRRQTLKRSAHLIFRRQVICGLKGNLLNLITNLIEHLCAFSCLQEQC